MSVLRACPVINDRQWIQISIKPSKYLILYSFPHVTLIFSAERGHYYNYGGS